jgi:hypothetical protein
MEYKPKRRKSIGKPLKRSHETVTSHMDKNLCDSNYDNHYIYQLQYKMAPFPAINSEEK